MRHFTMAWWHGVQEGLTEHPHDDYFAYVTALRSRVSPEQLQSWTPYWGCPYTTPASATRS